MQFTHDFPPSVNFRFFPSFYQFPIRKKRERNICSAKSSEATYWLGVIKTNSMHNFSFYIQYVECSYLLCAKIHIIVIELL